MTLYVLLYPFLLFLSASLSIIPLTFVSLSLSLFLSSNNILCVPPPSGFAVFRQRLSRLCGHCWRFDLQQKFENLDVEEEAGNMVVDEVGPLMCDDLFIRRGGTISWKDPKCGDFLRRKHGWGSEKMVWTQGKDIWTQVIRHKQGYLNPNPNSNPGPYLPYA